MTTCDKTTDLVTGYYHYEPSYWMQSSEKCFYSHDNLGLRAMYVIYSDEEALSISLIIYDIWAFDVMILLIYKCAVASGELWHIRGFIFDWLRLSGKAGGMPAALVAPFLNL